MRTLTSEKLKKSGIEPARNDPISITKINDININVSSIFVYYLLLTYKLETLLL
jgi:hypothetical protein